MPDRPDWTVVDFVHTGPFWRHNGILMLNLFLALPLLSAWMNGLDSSLVNGLQIQPDWQAYFHHPDGKALGLITAAQNIGALAGYPFSPILNDQFGRRLTLFFGSVIMLAGTCAQTFAMSVPMFIGARILIGFGLSFALSASPLLVTELAYPTQRGKLTSMYNACWYIGSIISAWACYAAYERQDSLWTWRIPTLIQGIVPILQILSIWFIPESPRWLVSKGRESEAASILARFHANTRDEHDPLVVFEMAQIRYALRMEKEAAQTSSFSALWATRGNRRRMMIIIAIAIFSQWSGNGLVSYYIDLVLAGVGVTSTPKKAIINGFLQLFNFFSAMTGALLVDRLGRRTLFLISNTGMAVVFAMWTLTTALFNANANAAAAKATIPLIFLFFFFYDLAYTPMIVAYTLEILPFHMRAKGFAVMNVTIGLTLAFNQFVNPWALEALGWKYYIMYCAWLLCELMFVLRFIVETKGRTLEETAALFDGERPPLELVQQGGDAATFQMSQRVLGSDISRLHSLPLGFSVDVEKTEDTDLDTDEYGPARRKGKRDSAGESESGYGRRSSSETEDDASVLDPEMGEPSGSPDRPRFSRGEPSL